MRTADTLQVGESTPERPTRSPIHPFICCAAITLALVLIGGFVAVSRYHEIVELESVANRLTRLDGVIMRLDETLTMSARMAAATGDPRWEQRYRDHEQSLDDAIKEALANAPAPATAAALATDAANAALVAMEDRAFALTRQGKLAEAAAVFDAGYDEHKRRYAKGMRDTMAVITQAVDDRLAAHRRTVIESRALAAIALALVVWLWLRMLARIRRYIRDRSDAEGQLVKAHATLEARVEERTREVAASREQYRFLVENIEAIPFEWDPGARRMVYIAPQASRLFECTLEQLRDDAFFQGAMHDDDRMRVRDRVEKFVAGDPPSTIDCRMITAARRIVYVRMILSTRTPARTLCGVMLDITKQVKLEAERQQSQKLESVGRLAAGVAHEINTPVQFVTDSVQFLRDSLADLMVIVDKHRSATRETAIGRPAGDLAVAAMAAEDELDMAYLSDNVPRAFDRALDGLSRVATIVRSMKVFAHPDRKDKAPIDINESLTSTLIIARGEYKYVADLETEFGELPPVSCYAGELNQVVLNLIINAAHAIGDVVGGGEQRGRITVTTRRDDDHVVIAIADTGTGIPAEIRDQVFDPFFTTKQVGKGTGQGLSHARSVIVDRHHGTLTFETAPGTGTTFLIRIPIDGAAQHHAAA